MQTTFRSIKYIVYRNGIVVRYICSIWNLRFHILHIYLTTIILYNIIHTSSFSVSVNCQNCNFTTSACFMYFYFLISLIFTCTDMEAAAHRYSQTTLEEHILHKTTTVTSSRELPIYSVLPLNYSSRKSC